MSLTDLLPEGPIRARLSAESDEITLSDLKDEYGEEAVKRGLSYMASLSDGADNYIENVERNKQEYEEKTAEGYGVENANLDDASEKWADESMQSGLKLKDEGESD